MKAIPARGNSSVGEGKRAKSAVSWRYAASSYSRQPGNLRFEWRIFKVTYDLVEIRVNTLTACIVLFSICTYVINEKQTTYRLYKTKVYFVLLTTRNTRTYIYNNNNILSFHSSL